MLRSNLIAVEYETPVETLRDVLNRVAENEDARVYVPRNVQRIWNPISNDPTAEVRTTRRFCSVPSCLY